MRKLNRKITSVVLAICMVLSCIAVGSFTASASTAENAVSAKSSDSAGASYGLASNIKDGNILHCFDWKYNDIKAELKNIAQAGFTSVQTSPAQTPDPLGQWYGLYLPREFKCTSGPLGTKAELQALCSEAENYGIKVVVDVVANHLTGDHANIQNDLKDGQYWHPEFDVSDWGDRYQITMGKIGMADLNTGHSYVQNVVYNYLQDLKGIGVDGFRFDAAKHIGLPSEGDGFWAKISNIGLYRYGEILDSPGGDANNVMKEYANYIGITDSDYSGTITGAIRDGHTVESNGNWVNRGISGDKIVYWGESHDTYSNDPPPKEGGWTKYLDQNIIDRAYAVLGAKANSQSLYLSRPYQKDKTSIMSGQKGSTHFTSPEVAAVNHFHNAMVGKKEYYTTGNNCFVVCREGGAVIVAAKGSNFDVTVPNGGSIVAQGSYKDEVSGGQWTVNGSSISGHIGQSGIAVIYNAKPAGPSASVTPGTTSYKTDSLTLTLSYDNATSGQYSIDNGSFQSFSNGQKITIGAGKEYGTVTTVKVKASGSSGTSDVDTYTYTKVDPNAVQQIYFDNSSYNWSNVYAYVYANEKGYAEWPGIQMQKDSSTDYYVIDVPQGFEDGKVIFTESKDTVDHRYPADQEPGMDLNSQTVIFRAGNKLEPYSPVTKPTNPTTPTTPTTPVGKLMIGDANLDGSVSISDATEIQMHAAKMKNLSGDNATAADVNGDNSITIKDATMIQLYLARQYNQSGNCGNIIGEDPTNPTTPTNPTDPIVDTTKVYFKNTKNWSPVKAYFWSDANPQMMSWPGNDMTDEGNGIYSASIPSGATKVIFTKGDDSGKTPDLDLQAGKMYVDGNWTNVIGGSVVTPTHGNVDTSKVYFRNSNNWSPVKAYFWSDANPRMMSWPGNDMTDEGNGVYSASIPDGATKVIFTKGDDSGKTPDLDLQEGKIYDNGWSDYNG